jgi:DNA-binding protein Alba
MVYETTIIIRNRSDKEKSIKDAIFAFSGGKKTLLIKGEGEEISTAVEVAEILKNRMYPRLEISNVSLGSRPFFENRNQRYNNRNGRYNNRNARYDNKNTRYDNRNTKFNGNKKDLISKIEITLQTKSYQ